MIMQLMYEWIFKIAREGKILDAGHWLLDGGATGK